MIESETERRLDRVIDGFTKTSHRQEASAAFAALLQEIREGIEAGIYTLNKEFLVSQIVKDVPRNDTRIRSAANSADWQELMQSLRSQGFAK